MIATILTVLCVPCSLLLLAIGAPAETHLIAPAIVGIGALGAALTA